MGLREDIYWLAGILEGEACFIAKKYQHGKYQHRQLRIGVEMCDKDIVERIKKITKATANVTLRNARPNRKHRPRYTINLNGARAIQWAQTIYPLMGERRQTAIREMIKIWKEFKPRGMKSCHYPIEEYRGVK